MVETIKRLTIEGFKSIRKLEDFELRGLNVLIGANGAGKSNFVSFFRLLREMIEQRLQVALATMEGGADACLYLGPKITHTLVAKLYFGNNGYEFTLLPTPDNRLVFGEETTVFFGNYTNRSTLGTGHFEAKLKDQRDERSRWNAGPSIPRYVFDAMEEHQVRSSTEGRSQATQAGPTILLHYDDRLLRFG